MPIRTFTAACLLLIAASSAWASPELARAKVCMGCHMVDKKLIGPAFKDISSRYSGQKDAAAKLADKIISGSSGTWGAVPMPANTKVTPEEARQLVAWIMTLK